MKARFLALAALVLGLASCQTEPEGLNANVGGAVDTTVTLSLPETTRANSTLGAFDNVVNSDKYTIRYILQVFYNSEESGADRQVIYSDGKTVNFPVRLVPGREYSFVAWADVVLQDGKTLNELTSVEDTTLADLHYDTNNLKNITLKNETWVAMDETRDAFTDVETLEYYGNSTISLELIRPFAKLRVVTTDMVELGHFNIDPAYATVDYKTEYRPGFNALAGKALGAGLEKKTHLKFRIEDYADFVGTAYEDTNKVLFTDYFFAEAGDAVSFVLNVFEDEQMQKPIKSNDFNTDIAVNRNYLTTIQGNILTDGNNITVKVEDAFENVNNGNTTDPNYEYKTISSDAEFLKAVNGDGGKYIVISDLRVAKAGDTVNTLATRAANGKTILINLNGKTITVDNQSNSALVTLGNDDTLIFAGEGDIVAAPDSKNKLVDGGNVVVTGAAEVDEDAATVVAGIEALKYILANGGEFNFTENLDANDGLDATDDVLLVSTTNPVVINGNNFNLTTSANRIVRITNSDAVVTFNDVNFISSAVMIYPSDVSGVAVDPALSNVALTLNNCSIDFTDKTTNDWTYAVNVAGNGTGHKVTINGGTYEGANVVNVYGAKNTIVVKNATLNSLYANSDLYYGSCIWVLQKQESSVYAEGNTFNGNNAIAFNLGTGTELVEKNNTDNTKYVAAKVGDVYYYNIAEAIAAAENGATVKVLQNHTCNVAATVPTGKTLTLDLDGKTITGTDSSTGSYALITNKGNLTITGNGKMTLKAENNREWNAYSSVISNTVGGKLVVENGTIEHLGGTDMAYGIDNLTNGKGTYAETVINGGTIKSTYRAVRMFLNGIEADNILTVNGGTIEGANKSIWMQDPSKNANTGKLVVAADAELKGDAYLTVTAGSTEWPVEVSIADDAFEGESTLLSNNVPTGYEVVNKGGIWTVVGYTEVSTADELIAALEANKSVKFMNDIKIAPANMSNAYGTTGINVKNGQTIDGNGKTLNIAGAGGTWDSGINTTGGLIKNLTVTGSFRGIFINHTSTYSEKVVLENVTIGGNGTVYTISCDQGLYQGIEATNCTFNGWTSFAKTAGEAKFVNCTFGEGSGYKYCRPYSNTEFVDCTFCPGYAVDTTRATVTFTDCTWEE